jgi:hypothetical protein
MKGHSMRAILLLTTLLAHSGQAADPAGQGRYLDLKPPGAVPELFAPGIVNCGVSVRDMTMMPDGTELYFSVFMPGFSRAVIAGCRLDRGKWSEPEVADFSQDPRWKSHEPCISPDGSKFFFVSDRPEDPLAGKPGTFGIWVMAREGRGWGAPRRLPAAVNGDVNVWYPSVEKNGDLYFLKEEGQGGWVMRAAWKDGVYQPAAKLPPPFNSSPRQANPRIDPEGRFLLLPMVGRPDSLGGADYYGHFRRSDGSWTGPVHLGPSVNGPAADEHSISLSPDGKVVFFGSNRLVLRGGSGPIRFADLLAERTRPGNGSTSIWWVDAGFLVELRKRSIGE